MLVFRRIAFTLAVSTLSVPAAQQPASTAPAAITVDYPFAETIFPPDFAPPTFQWRDAAKTATVWRIEVGGEDGAAPIRATSRGERMKIGEIDPRCIAETNKLPELTPEQAVGHTWKPDLEVWAAIKKRSSERMTTLVFTGVDAHTNQVVSRGELRFKTSKDPVGAPIFYRDVPMMSSDTEKGVIKPLPPAAIPLIAWRLRDVSKPESKKLLDQMPTCANCHSFSRDGSTMGMDLDGPQSDKGLYAIVPVKKQMEIRNQDLIAWSTFKGKLGGKLRVGFMSQVSPTGKYVITMINGAAVSPESAPAATKKNLQLVKDLEGNFYQANYKDYRFNQVFYPTRGILAWYSKETGQLKALPGADDETFVNTNATWSPDGKYIVFGRAKAGVPYPEGAKTSQFANDVAETPVQYDLYRIPFNDGKGGVPERVEGASQNGKSNSFARVSPDGKWIVYVQARNGLLMRPDSELYIVPFGGGTARRMRANMKLMNSWHSFSPTGRWLVFSSKSLSPYTQMFLTHIDEDGNDSPAILVENSTAANRAVNIPDFVNTTGDGIERLDVPAADFYRASDTARALAKKGDVPAAIAEWRRALALGPDDDRAHNSLGVLLAESGQFADALTEFQNTLRINPDFRDIHSNLGVALAGLQRVDEAVAEFQKALEVDPGSVEANNFLGRILEKKGEAYEATAHYRTALETVPDNPTALTNMGRLLVKAGKPDEATPYFEKALAGDSDFVEAHFQLGLVMVMTGKLPEAIPYFRKVLEISPAYPNVHYHLGRALAETGRADEATSQLEKALAADPNSAEVHAALGALLIQQRRVDQAMGHLQRAVELDPKLAEAHYYLGAALYFVQGKTADALAQWKTVLDLEPDHVPVLSQTSLILATNPDARFRDGAQAVVLAERAVKLTQGQDPIMLDTLAAAYAEAGRFDEAVQITDKNLAMARQLGNQQVIGMLSAKLALYQAKTPYRERR